MECGLQGSEAAGSKASGLRLTSNPFFFRFCCLWLPLSHPLATHTPPTRGRAPARSPARSLCAAEQSTAVVLVVVPDTSTWSRRRLQRARRCSLHQAVQALCTQAEHRADPPTCRDVCIGQRRVVYSRPVPSHSSACFRTGMLARPHASAVRASAVASCPRTACQRPPTSQRHFTLTHVHFIT